jgi:hypothetical protein
MLAGILLLVILAICQARKMLAIAEYRIRAVIGRLGYTSAATAFGVLSAPAFVRLASLIGAVRRGGNPAFTG